MPSIRDLIRDESGATAIEYALIASMIAIAIVGALSTIGPQLSSVFVKVTNAL
jgi:pilus assembly protein Flp/PilA